MKKLLALSLADTKNIVRDSTMILMLFGTVMLYLMLTLGVPLVKSLLMSHLNFDLTTYYPLIVSFLSMIPAMLFGLVTGFLILDERDEEIIAFIAVTPLGKKGYFTYKLMTSIIVTFLFYFVLLYFSGLVIIKLVYAVPLALLTAMQAPIVSLFLASFAGNKVEGLAMSKVVGTMYVAPFVAYFVHSNWQYLAGIVPTFWVTKAFLAAMAGDSVYWLFVVAGIVMHLLFIFLLLRIFLQKQR